VAYAVLTAALYRFYSSIVNTNSEISYHNSGSITLYFLYFKNISEINFGKYVRENIIALTGTKGLNAGLDVSPYFLMYFPS
jgi:hypothetical protein